MKVIELVLPFDNSRDLWKSFMSFPVLVLLDQLLIISAMIVLLPSILQPSFVKHVASDAQFIQFHTVSPSTSIELETFSTTEFLNPL